MFDAFGDANIPRKSKGRRCRGGMTDVRNARGETVNACSCKGCEAIGSGMTHVGLAHVEREAG